MSIYLPPPPSLDVAITDDLLGAILPTVTMEEKLGQRWGLATLTPAGLSATDMTLDHAS